MASLNPLKRELAFKIVFYGPGLGGKTTTLQSIHATARPEHRGDVIVLTTETDRTLYFDFLPIRVSRIRGMSVRLQLLTVPGQVNVGTTRKLVLAGADGIVFVGDSQRGRLTENRESLEDLVANLAVQKRSLADVPHTFHWNKRDLSDLVSMEELDSRFNSLGAPSLGTVATRGRGVVEGFERITRLVIRNYELAAVSRDAMGRNGDTRGAFSLADLWPESERDFVRHAEGLLAVQDNIGAVLACDVLVERTILRMARVRGVDGESRGVAAETIASEIGVSQSRHLAFCRLVQAARAGELVNQRDALESFAFALDVARSFAAS